MSTLNVTTITNGTDTITTEEVHEAINQATAKAWVNFNGTGNPSGTIRSSYNVSSVTDLGTGTYQINFTNAMPNANYCFAGAVGYFGVVGGMIAPYDYATSNVKMEALRQNAGGTHDFEDCNVVIFAS